MRRFMDIANNTWMFFQLTLVFFCNAVEVDLLWTNTMLNVRMAICHNEEKVRREDGVPNSPF